MKSNLFWTLLYLFVFFGSTFNISPLIFLKSRRVTSGCECCQCCDGEERMGDAEHYEVSRCIRRVGAQHRV